MKERQDAYHVTIHHDIRGVYVVCPLHVPALLNRLRGVHGDLEFTTDAMRQMVFRPYRGQINNVRRVLREVLGYDDKTPAPAGVTVLLTVQSPLVTQELIQPSNPSARNKSTFLMEMLRREYHQEGYLHQGDGLLLPHVPPALLENGWVHPAVKVEHLSFLAGLKARLKALSRRIGQLEDERASVLDRIDEFKGVGKHET